jgi:hypothetical protein
MNYSSNANSAPLPCPQAVLDDLLLDLLPPMAGLAHHSAACSNMLSTFCGLAVDACHPRDAITAFLEVLGNLVDGRCAMLNRQGCSPCMLLRANRPCIQGFQHCVHGVLICHLSYMGHLSYHALCK